MQAHRNRNSGQELAKGAPQGGGTGASGPARRPGRPWPPAQRHPSAAGCCAPSLGKLSKLPPARPAFSLRKFMQHVMLRHLSFRLHGGEQGSEHGEGGQEASRSFLSAATAHNNVTCMPHSMSHSLSPGGTASACMASGCMSWLRSRKTWRARWYLGRCSSSTFLQPQHCPRAGLFPCALL